jgi:hypothetical protein
MRRIRIRTALLAGWLILFYSTERLIDPVDITSVAYTVVFIVALLTLLIPSWSRRTLGMIVAIPIFIFLAIKACTGASVLGAATLLSLTEMGAIAVTIVLARWVSSAIDEFEDVIAHITIGWGNQIAKPPSTGQSLIYREVRRARNHERPLTLMAVAVEEESIHVALNRMVQEVQVAMIRQYTLSAVSRALCDELEDCDVLVQDNNHFLIALPEVTPEQLPGLRDQLRKLVSDRIGVSLSIGMASLPQDALTLEGLTEKAVKEMKGDIERPPSTAPTYSPVEHYSA